MGWCDIFNLALQIVVVGKTPTTSYGTMSGVGLCIFNTPTFNLPHMVHKPGTEGCGYKIAGGTVKLGTWSDISNAYITFNLTHIVCKTKHCRLHVGRREGPGKGGVVVF